MIKRFQRVSLVKQIIYLNVLMLSFLLVSFLISNYIAQRIVEDKVTESVNKLMLQLEATMKNFYKDMDGISYSLLYSPTLQQYLSTNDALTHILMDDDIVSQFSSTLSLKEDIKGILLYNNTGKLIANLGEKANITPKNQASVIEYTTSILPNSSYYTISVPVYNLQNNIKLKDYRGMCVFLMDGARFNELLQTSKQSPIPNSCCWTRRMSSLREPLRKITAKFFILRITLIVINIWFRKRFLKIPAGRLLASCPRPKCSRM